LRRGKAPESKFEFWDVDGECWGVIEGVETRDSKLRNVGEGDFRCRCLDALGDSAFCGDTTAGPITTPSGLCVTGSQW